VKNGACDTTLKEKGFFKRIFSKVKYTEKVVAVKTENKVTNEVNKLICDFAGKTGNGDIAACYIADKTYEVKNIGTWTKIKAFGGAMLEGGKCLWEIETVKTAIK